MFGPVCVDFASFQKAMTSELQLCLVSIQTGPREAAMLTFCLFRPGNFNMLFMQDSNYLDVFYNMPEPLNYPGKSPDHYFDDGTLARRKNS